jgi:hypothetical protein
MSASGTSPDHLEEAKETHDRKDLGRRVLIASPERQYKHGETIMYGAVKIRIRASGGARAE